jgi:hypothetical protein
VRTLAIEYYDDSFTPTELYIYRLNDVVQSEGRLYLVFEFVDKDLKKYFEACDGMLSPQLIKVYN